MYKNGSALRPRVVTPSYFYNLSCAFLALNLFNCFRNRTKITRANVLLLLLPRALLWLFFTSNSAAFVSRAQQHFFPQRRVPLP